MRASKYPEAINAISFSITISIISNIQLKGESEEAGYPAFLTQALHHPAPATGWLVSISDGLRAARVAVETKN